MFEMKFLKKWLNPQILVLIFLSSIFLISCSDNLSREKAETLIKDKFGLPYNEERSFKLYYENGYGINNIRFLEQEGLISIREIPVWMGSNFSVQLTESGQQYWPEHGLIGDDQNSTPIVTSFVSFGEITGIVERKGLNEAEVDFTLVRSKVTPFGKAYKLFEGAENQKLIFKKYDDGWRINQ
jgi:hypothetical protein